MRQKIAWAVVAAMFLVGTMAWTSEKQDERLKDSQQVFQEIMDAPDKGIPQDLLARAACVGVIPSVKKLALGIGGQHGSGYILCRRNSGKGAWGPPSGYSMSGGSFGLQLGFSATDYVLLFMNTDGVRKLLQDKFTLGADASVAAGPVGRSATASTDAQMTAKVLGYSRNKGLFAGLALNGAVLRPSGDDNEEMYGRKVAAKDILLDAKVSPPAAARGLIQLLTKYSSGQSKKAL
jgi:SH3 domain-containing YSC84-like protein 1